MDTSNEAGTAVSETSMCRKVRSSEDPPIETTDQEMNYRLKLYPDPGKVLKEKIRCTACAKPLLKEVMSGRTLYSHPILEVLVCEDCQGFYGNGDFPLDEDNSDTYCRWCAQGGNLYCCSSCNFVFCKPCIRRNFRHSMLEEIMENDWNCFVCNPEALWKHRAVCWAAKAFSKSCPVTPSNDESSEDDSVRMRRERSRRACANKLGRKSNQNNEKQKRKKRRSKQKEISEDSDEKTKTEEEGKPEKRRKSVERKADDNSSLERIKLSSSPVIEKISLPLVEDDDVDSKKKAMLRKTCMSMEKLTVHAKHVTNTGTRKMHELYSWISRKNASPRKQGQLSPLKLKKMISSFLKIIRGLKENAEEMERKARVIEEEWMSILEGESKTIDEIANVEERVDENLSVEENIVKENRSESVTGAVDNEDNMSCPSNIRNSLSMETDSLSESKLIENEVRDVSDAETILLNNCDDVCSTNEDIAENESRKLNNSEGKREVCESNEGKNTGQGDSINERSKLNVSIDIFEAEDIPPVRSSIVSSESVQKEAAEPVVGKDEEDEYSKKKEEGNAQKKYSGKKGEENDRNHGLGDDNEKGIPIDDKGKETSKDDSKKVALIDDEKETSIDDNEKEKSVDDSETETLKDPITNASDEIEHNDKENEANKENIKPSKDDRDAKLEFLLDSLSSEESDNKFKNKLKKSKEKVNVVVDSTESSDSDSDYQKRMKVKKKEVSKELAEKITGSEFLAQFSDEKLKKGCSVVVERIGLPNVNDHSTRRKSGNYPKNVKDAMERAIERLGNLSSLEKPPKKKEQSSNSDSDSNKAKKEKKPVMKDSKKNEIENNKESPEEEQSEEVPHVSSDELEMELKAVPKNDDSKMAELAKNMLVENSSDSDSDFFLSTKDKKEKLKRKEKSEKLGNLKTDDESSDSDSGKKSSKNSWKNNRLLTSKLSETDSSEEERKWKEKKKRLEGDSDEDMKSKVKTRNRRARLMSSSSEAKISSKESSDNDSDIDDKKKRKRGRKSESSESTSSGSTIKKKKKRRRIKLVDSNSDSDENKSEEVDEKKNKGRKNIQRIIKDKMLGEGAKLAAKDEEERKKRIAERQKLYNEYFVNKEQEATLEKLVLDFDPDTKEELVAVHPTLVKKLKPHQAEGVKFMWDACFETLKRMETEKGSGCILAHCMGLGKSVQVVALVHTLLQNPKTNMKRVLIICPLNTVLNWVNEFEIWLNDVDSGSDIEVFELTRYKADVERMYQLKHWHSNGGVMILGYEMFRTLLNGRRRRKKVQETFVSALADPGPDLVICDEGHQLKNLQSAISKAVNSIKTERRIVLTGTPLQNNLKEYHCMIQFVKPNLLGTHKEFLNRFVNPISNGQCADSTPHDVKIMKRRAHVLHKMLDGCVQRRDFPVMIPYLPPKHEYVICICLTELQSRLYSYFLQTFSQKGTGGGASLFNDFQNLQRIWTHPRALKMSTEKQVLKKMMQSDSEGSIKDFICDDTDESDTTETTSESSDDDVDDDQKKRKKLKRTCADGGSNSSDSSVVFCAENGDKKKELNEGENEKEDIIPLEQKAWWESFVQPDDHDKISHSGKLMLLMAILKKCEMIGDKVLLFSQSLYSLDLIEYFLEYVDSSNSSPKTLDQSSEGGEESPFQFAGSWVKGIDYFRIDGSVSGENRSMWCKSFNRENNTRARLFLISTKAGGMGINLVGANRVILFDASWNPSNDVQSIYRIYRFGQKKPCYVYRFLAQGTMEEKIYNRQVTKLSLASRVLDEHQIERHYNFDDLQELYSYEPTDMSKKPAPILPKDRLLAELVQGFPNLIYNYHEHDSLLQNIAEEELTEEERKAAWDDFENEKKERVPENLPVGFGPIFNNNSFGGTPYPTNMNVDPGIIEALRNKIPNSNQEQLAAQLRLLAQYLPNGLQHLYKQIPENMMQPNMALYPPMRQMYDQSVLLDQQAYRNYAQNSFLKPSSNSSQLTAHPAKVQNNLQQYTSNAQSIPPVQFSAQNSTAKPPSVPESSSQAPRASDDIPRKGTLKIRPDLFPPKVDDNEIIIESVLKRN